MDRCCLIRTLFSPLLSLSPLRRVSLCELLLDKEGAQVGQLPDAGDAEDGELDEDPADDAAVCALGLVAELGFALL